MDESMNDAALLEADCAAEDRFVFNFARRLRASGPTGVQPEAARALASLLLDEAWEQQRLPGRLSLASVQACIERARVPTGTLAIVSRLLGLRQPAAAVATAERARWRIAA